MKRRNAVHLVVWSFLAAAGCSSTSAPALPACGSALASQVALPVGRDTTLDPAADSGCVTFAANLSAVDSVEYLLVPQSTAGTFGESSPFLLRTTTLTAAAPAVGQGVIASSSPRLAAVQADLETWKQEVGSPLYPLDAAPFGGVSDIDANSVVIVLMTGVVNKLVSKATCLSRGFIAGFFFSADLEVTAPSSISNHGEVFYSIVADSAGTLSCSHSRP